MRYKKFRISGAIDLDDISTLWVTNISINDGNILRKDRVDAFDIEPAALYDRGVYDRGVYDYIKVAKYLYKRVDSGSDIDEDYGNATFYYYILPEIHPAFNFDILYKVGRDDEDLALYRSSNSKRKDGALTILSRYLPDFVNNNTYE